MEVGAEAKRIMVVALGKLYSSRSQRGGLRLHRSLLLSLVMKSARDIYHEAQMAAENAENAEQPVPEPQPAAVLTSKSCNVEVQPRAEVVTSPRRAQDKENRCPSADVPAPHSRKRRGKAAAEPDFLPCKKAKLEQANAPHPPLVTPVLLDYGVCTHPTPIHVHNRAIAAC